MKIEITISELAELLRAIRNPGMEEEEQNIQPLSPCKSCHQFPNISSYGDTTISCPHCGFIARDKNPFAARLRWNVSFGETDSDNYGTEKKDSNNYIDYTDLNTDLNTIHGPLKDLSWQKQHDTEAPCVKCKVFLHHPIGHNMLPQGCARCTYFANLPEHIDTYAEAILFWNEKED